MAYPSVSDDGSTVTLDLHGATVSEAERLARRAVSAAYESGRNTVRIVHGSSTSHGNADRETIRDRIRRLAAEQAFGSFVTSYWTEEDILILGLARAGSRKPGRMSILDIM